MTKLKRMRVGRDIVLVSLSRSLSVLEFMWTSIMTNETTLKHDKPNHTIDRGYSCHKCGSRGDVFSLGKLLCAICYLLEYAPERVDKIKRKII